MDLENKLTVNWGGGGHRGRDREWIWDQHEHIAIFKTDNQQDLLYRTGSFAQ